MDTSLAHPFARIARRGGLPVYLCDQHGRRQLRCHEIYVD
jgi:hypothetical protein